MNSSTKRITIFSILGIILAIGVGFLIGFFSNGSKNTDKQKLDYYNNLIKDFDTQGLDHIIKEVKANSIREFLKNITFLPHQAGTEMDRKSADYILNSFKDFDLDHYDIFEYDVLLDYPDEEKFNNIEIKTSNSVLETLYEIKEPILDPNTSPVSKPFLAYAKNGSVTSDELFYANFCMEDDFKVLIENGLNVKDKLVLCRYGKIFRGNKVQVAEKFGAKGLILFDDPIRVAPSLANDLIYPVGEFLPSVGTQRGSILVTDGDPLTPFYPSNEYGYRLEDEIADNLLPKIPAQVIGYAVAYDLFKQIENNKPVKNEWRGELNMSYTYGGKLKDNRLITLNVFNQRERRKTYNVMGFIEGTDEPDRYVMIGNHRDSWTLGSMDPSSGTALLLELSRVMMKLKKENKWRPKRSVMFLSWGAEEYGLIGSVEWVEEYLKKLQANSVAYLNIDTMIKGNYSYRAYASPVLFDFIFEVAKNIKQTSNETVFDRWLKNDPNSDKTEPKVSPYLGSGSDHMSFLQKVGVPCVEQYFARDKTNKYFKNMDSSSYPTYHSSYETFRLIDEILDPKFETFRMVGVIVAELLRRLSEHLILPFNVERFSKELKSEYTSFEREYKQDLLELNIKLDQLEYSIQNLTKVSADFTKRLKSIDKTKYHLVRMYNDQLRNFEKAFLDMSGRDRNSYYHMIYAPSISDAYGGDVFPSVTDAIYDYKKNPSKELLEKIKLQISIVIYTIQSACSVLKEHFDFKRYV
ncbi:unnamed protein product [Brachionus calyciflorus]|uniref:Aminopeptidase NAALADL1 n=1 Tax=Brachionus calyciflorus TaxID=104777 RepID=A0A814BNV3_9BILA|nr:unnamed protein product [Brachionus calyciflorus]